MTKKITLITGGSRSGKSRLAHARALAYPERIFLATAEATDPEMAKRIAKHREERGSEFMTVEEPLYLARAIQDHAKAAGVLWVDCLTFWLNNLFHYWDDGTPVGAVRISKEIEDFLKALVDAETCLILVTNEVNMGVVGADALTRRFVDQQASLN